MTAMSSNIILMGSGQSIQPETGVWKPEDWHEVPHQSLTYGKTTTLRNHHTGALVDMYELSWQSKREY